MLCPLFTGNKQAVCRPGKSTALNLRILFTNTQAILDEVGSWVNVSYDTAKALDSIEWNFLFATIAKFGFRSSFIQ